MEMKYVGTYLDIQIYDSNQIKAQMVECYT